MERFACLALVRGPSNCHLKLTCGIPAPKREAKLNSCMQLEQPALDVFKEAAGPLLDSQETW
jgi:hypothetical protein